MRTPTSPPSTNFRDGIIENFAASETYPGPSTVPTRPGRGQRTIRREVHAVDRQRPHVVARANGERCAELGIDRPVPAVSCSRAGRRRGGRLLRPPTSMSERPVDPPAASDANTCIDVSLQAHKDPGQRPAPYRSAAASGVSPVHLGPGPVSAEGRRHHPIRLRRTRRPVPEGAASSATTSGRDLNLHVCGSTHYHPP